jgi:hypothetical protein
MTTRPPLSVVGGDAIYHPIHRDAILLFEQRAVGLGQAVALKIFLIGLLKNLNMSTLQQKKKK